MSKRAKKSKKEKGLSRISQLATDSEEARKIILKASAQLKLLKAKEKK